MQNSFIMTHFIKFEVIKNFFKFEPARTIGIKVLGIGSVLKDNKNSLYHDHTLHECSLKVNSILKKRLSLMIRQKSFCLIKATR